jgi:uncharacterized coiled-coil protein SlyX
MTTYAAAIAARLQREREDEDMAGRTRKKNEGEGPSTNERVAAWSRAMELVKELDETLGGVPYNVLTGAADPSADARVAELEQNQATNLSTIQELHRKLMAAEKAAAEYERELDTVRAANQELSDRVTQQDLSVPSDAFLPVPIRWRHVLPGDVLAVKRGDEVEPWLVRVSRAGDPTGWTVEVARTGADVPRNVDPDDEVPVLVAAAVADAFVVLREQGAEMVGRA